MLPFHGGFRTYFPMRTVRCGVSRPGGCPVSWALGALRAGSCPWGSGKPCLAGGQSRDSHGMTLEEPLPPWAPRPCCQGPCSSGVDVASAQGAWSPGLPGQIRCGGPCDSRACCLCECQPSPLLVPLLRFPSPFPSPPPSLVLQYPLQVPRAVVPPPLLLPL